MPNHRDYQPFRYPGGKTKLAQNPAFQALIDSILVGSDTLYEGFLGSAAVTLDVALRRPDLKFIGIDRDVTISGFWQLISEGTDDQVNELLGLISQTPTVELFQRLRTESPVSLVDRAYHAIFFNRTAFSGISISGPIGKYDQTSKWKITCRYNAVALQKKIKNLRQLFAGRWKVINGECIDWLKEIPADVPLYLDPPYFIKGDMLYPERMDAFQHGRLAATLATRTNWIMSYDICDEIRKLYDFAQLLEIGFRYSINGKKNNWKATNEYLIVSPEIDTRPFELADRNFKMDEAG